MSENAKLFMLGIIILIDTYIIIKNEWDKYDREQRRRHR